MISPETKYLNIAKEIILKYVPKDDFAVFLFGSRANGKYNRTSDIDIGFMGEKELPIMIKSTIEDELEESIIPYTVDLIDFKKVSPDFREIALEHIMIWNCPKNITLK